MTKELTPYEHWQLTVKGNILPEYQHRGAFAPPATDERNAQLRELEQPTDQRELNQHYI